MCATVIVGRAPTVSVCARSALLSELPAAEAAGLSRVACHLRMRGTVEEPVGNTVRRAGAGWKRDAPSDSSRSGRRGSSGWSGPDLHVEIGHAQRVLLD